MEHAFNPNPVSVEADARSLLREYKSVDDATFEAARRADHEYQTHNPNGHKYWKAVHAWLRVWRIPR